MRQLVTYRQHRTEERVIHACLVDIRCPDASDSKETKRSLIDAECLRFENIPCLGIYAHVEVTVVDYRFHIYSRSLNILLDRLSKVYGSEPRSPWILLAVNNAAHVDNECATYFVVQTQRIVRLQVFCGLHLSPRYRQTRHEKALVVASIGGLRLFQQQL